MPWDSIVLDFEQKSFHNMLTHDIIVGNQKRCLSHTRGKTPTGVMRITHVRKFTASSTVATGSVRLSPCMESADQ